MFRTLSTNFIKIIQYFRTFFFYSIFFFNILTIICPYSSCSYAASLSTDSSHRSELLEFLSNQSYHQSMLRQYFLDQIPIPSEKRGYQRQKRSSLSHEDESSIPSMYTIQSMNCLENHSNHHVYSTFQWSHAMESIARIELIYHIDSKARKEERYLPIRIIFKQFYTFITLRTIDTKLEYDSIRDSFILSLESYLHNLKNRQILIETIVYEQTCNTSRPYLIVSPSPPSSSSSTTPSPSTCRVRTILVDFEKLGLANLIIRPKQYQYTYCDGACSSPTFPLQSFNQHSMHTFLRSILLEHYPQLPAAKCAPAEYADEHFLLRNSDGTMAIYPIPNILVKQCVCL